LRVNQELTDPTRRILCYREFGRISTLAAAISVIDAAEFAAFFNARPLV
jgi:hypothetical protein